jgi:hypothetical protein
MCSKASVDTAGNKLFQYTGEMGRLNEIYPFSDFPAYYGDGAFIRNGIQSSTYLNGNNLALYKKQFGMSPVAQEAGLFSFDTSTLQDVIIEFSTTPISGTTP